LNFPFIKTTQSSSVDSILGVFKTTIDNLLNLSEDKERQAEEIGVKIIQLDAQREEAVVEATRAKVVANKLTDLITTV